MLPFHLKLKMCRVAKLTPPPPPLDGQHETKKRMEKKSDGFQSYGTCLSIDVIPRLTQRRTVVGQVRVMLIRAGRVIQWLVEIDGVMVALE